MTELAVPRRALAAAARALAHAGRWQDAAALLDAAPADPLLALTAAQVAIESDWFAGTTSAPARLATATRLCAGLDDMGRWDLAFVELRHAYRTQLMDAPPVTDVDVRALAVDLGATAPDAVRGGWAEMYQGLIADNLRDDRAAAPAHYHAALEAGEADPLLAREALRHLGDHDHGAGEQERALDRWRRATELGAAAGNVPGTLSQQLLLAVHARDAGNEAGAVALAGEVARWAGAIGAAGLAGQAAAIATGADPTPPPPAEVDSVVGGPTAAVPGLTASPAPAAGADAAAVEMPVVETPAIEQRSVETRATEVRATETRATETRSVEATMVETPAVEALVTWAGEDGSASVGAAQTVPGPGERASTVPDLAAFAPAEPAPVASSPVVSVSASVEPAPATSSPSTPTVSPAPAMPMASPAPVPAVSVTPLASSASAVPLTAAPIVSESGEPASAVPMALPGNAFPASVAASAPAASADPGPALPTAPAACVVAESVSPVPAGRSRPIATAPSVSAATGAPPTAPTVSTAPAVVAGRSTPDTPPVIVSFMTAPLATTPRQ